ncbi:MAG: LPS export ABC transporter periplasmic protein LptC [Candidatus Amoebophilus sp.]
MRISKKYLFNLLIFILLLTLSLANNQDKKQELPLIESTNMEVLYSEEGIVVAKMCAESRLQYENGNSIYPAGMYVECYDKQKKLIATLRANTAYQYVDKEMWELKGDVEVKGYHEGDEQQLNTEELYWNLKTNKIYTDKFVRLETGNELLTGYGIDAMQDLSYYSMSSPEGFVNVDSAEIQ